MSSAIVTGASSGIGHAVARRLATRGLAVACAARRAEPLADLVASIELAGGRAAAYSLDVRDAGACQRVAQEVARQLGPVEVLVNNAGVGIFGSIAEFDPADWDATIATNLSGAFYLTRAVLPSMIERRGGHLLSIGSVAGHRGFAGGAAYVASKHGLRGFHECVMLDARQHGVRCTLISPGSVDTAFFEADKARDWMLTADDVADAVAYALDAKGNALVDEVLVRPISPPKPGG